MNEFMKTNQAKYYAAVLAGLAGHACAQSAGAAQSADQGTGQTMPSVEVHASQETQRQLSPATIESVTAQQLADTTNVMNTEDALKYLPSILVRKRFTGDTQAPVATRTTGINASARSLIFADGVMLSALVNNNNANGSPRWFMVSPEEIDSIDVMYGPFSAAYAGNSYGAVIKINTRMPTQFEATVNTTLATQKFGEYGSNDRYGSGELNATLGDRSGKFAWFFSANHLDSSSQPITFGTLAQSGTAPAPGLPVIGGARADTSRTGSPILVLGAGNFTHTVQDTAKIKLAYDVTPALTAAYVFGYWQNQAKAGAQSYLTDAGGAAYYGAGSGNVSINGRSYSASAIAGQFSSNSSEQDHWMQSLSIASKTRGTWDWEAVVSGYHYVKDLTNTSTGPYPAAANGGAGRIADAGGSGWSTADVNGTWRPDGMAGPHSVSFGVHDDVFKLVSPTFNTSDWTSDREGSLFSDARGRTQTRALWLQDIWRLSPSLSATVGARYEQWRAYGGYNYSLNINGSGFAVVQPDIARSGWSSKASLRWTVDDLWQVTGSLGRALRFPTVGELYQNVQTGTTFVQANPFLKPEDVKSGELALERSTAGSRLRLSLFEEHVSNALISQTSTIAGFATPVSFTQNVDKTRQRGIELVADQQDALIRGLELNGSVTYVDAVILANSGYVPTIAGATSVGKHTPYIPDWRATATATWRPNDKWAFTLAGRYSGKQYATVDNTDVNGHTYQGFEGFFVADARLRYRISRQWALAGGIDNLNNRNYFLFHPFPQRTVYTELKFTY
jgi:iron complex outermembrane receptor protein